MSRRLIYCFIAEILAFCIISSLVARINIFQGVEFFLFMMIVIFIPGLAINMFLKIKYDNLLKLFFSSFAIGYAISVITYLICLICGIQRFVSIPILVVCLFAIGFILFNKNHFECPQITKKEMTWAMCLIAFMYLSCLLLFQGNTLSPEVNGYLYANQDFIFWLKNQAAVFYSYPVPDFNIYGQQLQYHFFSNLPLASAHIITGIELFDLCFTFSYIVAILLLFGALYLLGSEFVGNRLLPLFLVLILFCTGFEPITYAYYIEHLYYYMGFTEALAFSMLSFFFFLKGCELKSLNIYYLISIFFFYIAMGLKAPVACVTFAGIGIGCLLLLLKKETIQIGFIVGISLVISFGLSLLTITSGRVLDMSKNNFNIDFTYTLFGSGFFKGIYDNLTCLIPLPYFDYGISVVLYLISALFIPICLLFLCSRNSAKKMPLHSICLAAMSAIGVILSLSLSHFGFAQIWFLIAIIPYSIFLPVTLLQNARYSIKYIRKYVICICLLGVLCSLYTDVRLAASGFMRCCGLPPKNKDNSGMSITKKELEGLRWVRDNTPIESVLLSNKVIAYMGSHSAILSAFTERQSFYEYYNYADDSPDNAIEKKLSDIRACFEGNVEKLVNFQRQGVNYLIVFKALEYNNSLYLNNLDRLVYENDEMFVLKLI